MKNILPSILEEYPKWYIATLKKAQLYDNTQTRGAIVMKPYACQIWEKITELLKIKIKEYGYQDYYFPALITKDIFSIEKEQVDGMADELFLLDDLVLRPTSESIISQYMSESRYSYRDLPVKINQWCSVFRKELRPRPFLRGSEFLWHEAHALYQDRSEMLDNIDKVYSDIYGKTINEDLSIFTFSGEKTARERFNGAVNTYTHEAISRENKAIQIATVHDLSRNFVDAFHILYMNKEGKHCRPYQMCFGASTRLIGAIVAVHGDQYGLRLPPKIAPYQLVILKLSSSEALDRWVEKIEEMVKISKFRVFVDNDTHIDTGRRIIDWEIKGVPIQIRIGLRELKSSSISLYRRITGEKVEIHYEDLVKNIDLMLSADQEQLYTESKNQVCNSLEPCSDTSSLKQHLSDTQNRLYKIKMDQYNEKLEKTIYDTPYSVRCKDNNQYIIAKSY